MDIAAQDALVVDGVTKGFRGVPALRQVSFSVREASLTVLLGAAGAGKTTMLRVIAGLDNPDSGRVTMGGRDAGSLEPKDRNIAMIFDNLALYPDKTAFENIANPLVIRRLPEVEIKERVRAIAATLHISHLLAREPKTMSGGERQRVALGRALVRKPGLCLLDEPLSSLDAMLRVELRAELKRLQREHGYSFLLATPDFAEAMAVADTVVMLRSGRVIQTCEAQTLYDSPIDREVARFVGTPEINLLPASIQPAVRGEAVNRIQVAGASVPVPGYLEKALSLVPGRFELGLRPECLALADLASSPAAARVIDIEPLGLKSIVTVRNDSAELRLVVDAHTAGKLVIEENVGIDFSRAPMLVFDSASGMRLG